jgi:YfiH family protein
MSFRAAGEHIAIDLPGGTALFTTRHGGVSEGPYASLNLGSNTDDDPAAVAANRARAAELAGAPVAALHQVHGTGVVETAGGAIPEADAQVSRGREHAPMVLVADCVPVALVAPEAVGVVHAGWRGLHGGVIAAAVRALRDLGAARVAAAVGPAIGPCCYQVGDELRAAFGTTAPTLDLPGIAAAQLTAAGVADVHAAGLCTACATRDGRPLFFSHRRDRGVTGRQAGIAWRS